MTILLYKLLLGLFASSLIGFFAYISKYLTKSGVMATIIIGTIICTVGTWQTWGVIILFFASSGLIHIFTDGKRNSSIQKINEKGHTRDAAQILANSLPAVISLLLYFFTKNQLFLVGYISGIAGATADTWASELGILNRKTPTSILTGDPVVKGVSGGVSAVGFISSFLGSLLIAGFFSFSYSFNAPFSVQLFMIPILTGFFSSVFDSLLGDSSQALYSCQVCHQDTEKRQHHDKPTLLKKGRSWINNDMVNFLSGIFTIAFSWFLSSFYWS